MKIKFCGAAEGVTGSCHLLEAGGHKILLDCGQFQGGKTIEAMNWEEFPFNPEEIEAVVLSHAHIDHCGRLPLLVKKGFRGNVYCTDATAQLVDIMLKDSGYIHEKEAEWQNRKALRSGKPAKDPLYTYRDAVHTLQYIKPVMYDTLIELNDAMKIVFNDAGHILGSAITEIWATEEGRTSKIVFSGDLGVKGRPILRDPTVIKKADVVIMESTYGNRVHPENRNSVDELLDIIRKTVKRGGNVVIPSFAVGRTQELIYQLNRLFDISPELVADLKGVKVYIDSPMATNATQVFKDNAQVFDEEAREFLMNGDQPLEFEGLEFTRSTEDSQRLNMDPTPKIIISASGMCEAGRIRHHLKHNLWNRSASVVFVGYQAEGTLGRMLVNGVKDVVLFGEPVHVACEIYNLEGFSGHADRDGLVEWISSFEKKPKQLFLVHGEDDSKSDLAETIKRETGIDATVVRNVAEYELETGRMLTSEETIEEVLDDEAIGELRHKLIEMHGQLENLLYQTSISLNRRHGEDLLALSNRINQLEKSVVGLSSTVYDRGGEKSENTDNTENQA